MGRKVRSAKGELVDFDLLKIKQQMQSAPKSVEVKAREDFIEKRLKRRQARQAARAAEKAKQKLTEDSSGVTIEQNVNVDEAETDDTVAVRKTKRPTKK